MAVTRAGELEEGFLLIWSIENSSVGGEDGGYCAIRGSIGESSAHVLGVEGRTLQLQSGVTVEAVS